MDALSAIKAHFADEPRVFILSDRLNAMQYKGYVKRLCGLVTARTHVSVAAYSTFVPTLVIGYSVKARGIARDLFGSEEGHLIPAQELSGETELIAAYDALMRRGEAEREQLKARMPSYMAGRGRDDCGCSGFGGRKTGMRQTVRKNPAECTGCGACVSICPKQAIVMQPDTEGFLYPKVDGEKCISCDLCEKRCPAGREMPEHHARLLGAQAKDEALRRQSSSGGVFTLLAREVIRRGGVVFGAAFGENMRVEHVGAFDETELSGMRGSKYVQSDATDAIGNAVSLLKREIPVLFSGTPCQINGLLAALGNTKSDKLLTVDFVCHGVPSPGVFASYLVELEKKHGSRVSAYTFRDKRLGWKNFSAVATFENGEEHAGTQTTEPYLYGFLQNLYLRSVLPFVQSASR